MELLTESVESQLIQAESAEKGGTAVRRLPLLWFVVGALCAAIVVLGIQQSGYVADYLFHGAEINYMQGLELADIVETILFACGFIAPLIAGFIVQARKPRFNRSSVIASTFVGAFLGFVASSFVLADTFLSNTALEFSYAGPAGDALVVLQMFLYTLLYVTPTMATILVGALVANVRRRME